MTVIYVKEGDTLRNKMHLTERGSPTVRSVSPGLPVRIRVYDHDDVTTAAYPRWSLSDDLVWERVES